MAPKAQRCGISVSVIGAGAFGGWTALELRRRGARVTLFDAWGPGNSRASSGGETRVLRAAYGPDRIYTRMAVRALELWRRNQARWKRQLFHPIGVLWMASSRDDFEKAALPVLRQEGVRFEVLEPKGLQKRFPQVNFEGIRWGILEREAGFLHARAACEAVRGAFVAEGGDYRQAQVSPGAAKPGRLESVTLSDGSAFRSDCWVFACGPWLGQIFPEVLASLIAPTRQEVFFFGPPPGDARFVPPKLPVWIDYGEKKFYGIPGNQDRGFKLASDERGEAFDPTSGDRVASAEGIRAARAYLEFRFPGMRGAPLVESRVCQYEQSRDGHFILDRHPELRNVWVVGGGSGHGFKHGPAVGEMVARMVLEENPPEPAFALTRFGQP